MIFQKFKAGHTGETHFLYFNIKWKLETSTYDASIFDNNTSICHSISLSHLYANDDFMQMWSIKSKAPVNE